MAASTPIVRLVLIALYQALGHNPHDVVGGLGAAPDGSTVFAVVRRVLYRSVNGGLNWDMATRGITGMDTSADGILRTVAVSRTFDKDHTVFLNNMGGVFRSTDEGLKWELVHADDKLPAGLASIALSKNFAAEKKVLVAASAGQVFRSQDGGTSFKQIPPPAVSGQRSMLATDNAVFMVTDKGDFAWSLDFGESWSTTDLKPLIKGTDVSFNSVSEISLDSDSPYYGRPDSLEAGWQVGSLVLGAPNGAQIVVYTYKPGGSAADFEVFRVTAAFTSVTSVAQVGVATLPGETLSTSFVLPTAGRNVYRAAPQKNLELHRVIKDYDDLGKDWQDQAAALHTSTLSMFSAGSGTIYLGTFCGLHKSVDGGVNWVKLDVESRRITQLVVMPSDDNALTFSTCTYGDGCFGGTINVDQLRKGNEASIVTNPVHWNEERYCTMTFSPSYKEDGTILRRCATDAQAGASILWRSTDHGKSFSRVKLPILEYHGSGLKPHPGVFSMAFSPAFDEDGTIFVSGVTMGLLVSQDKGDTFTMLKDFEGRAVKVYVSPDFKNDQTLLVLAAELYYAPGMSFSDFSAWRGDTIFMSRDAGESWPVQQRGMQLESVYFSHKFATDRTIVGFRMIENLVTRLVTTTDGGNHWNDVQPGELLKDFGRGGITLGPDHFFGSYLEGGTVVGPLASLQSGNGYYRASETGKEVPFSFVQDTDDELDVRTTGNLVAFANNVVFGTSFYSLYASVDFGATWKVVYKLQHTDSQCDVSNCNACHLKDHRECISCRAGFHPNALAGGCDAGKGLSLLGLDSEHAPSRMPGNSDSRWYLELITILSVVTLAGYAIVCRIWAYYACKQHKLDAESRRGATNVCDATTFGAAC